MKIRARMKWLMMLGMLVAFLVHAAIPASKAYLDSRMAVIQAEVDEINLTLLSN